MEKYKNAEIELNKYPDPSTFHDMSVINMEFSNDKIIIKFILAKYMDCFGILDDTDDKHFAILEVTYTGINIKKMNLYGLICFMGLDVLCLEEKNGTIKLDICNNYTMSFNFEFTFKDYHWRVCDIITENVYYEYCDWIPKYEKRVIECREYWQDVTFDMPEWAKI